MKVCVIGAGAIGGVIAAWMARQGHEVCVTARGPHLAALKAHGLRLIDQVSGEDFLVKPTAAENATDFGPQDLVVIAVKGPALASVATQVPALLQPKTVVVPALNGLPWWYFYGDQGLFANRSIQTLDSAGLLSSAIAWRHLIGCVVHVAAEVTAPGEITQTAHRKLFLGEPDNTLSPRLATLCTALGAARFEVIQSSDIRRDLWVKLIGNLAFNPIAALTGLRMDQMIEDPALVALARPLIEESNAVAAALGVHTGISTEQRIDMARSIGRARLSTLQDFEKHRCPELEGLLGSVIEVAQWVNVPVPTVRHVAALLYAKARGLGLIGADVVI
jgi:2-dehydropantoate 2-reductase